MSFENGLRILVVDDDALVRRSLCESLSFEGYSVEDAGNGGEALSKLAQSSFDIMISDMKMPQMDGLELLSEARKQDPRLAVIMMTGFGSIEGAVQAMRQGAFDYITKPVIDDEIKLIIQRIRQERKLEDENTYLRRKVSSASRRGLDDILGSHYKMQKIFDLIDMIATTRTTVLVTGESGTGKRMVAHAIHKAHPQADSMPFVEVSCGALPETLLESELFGHVKGAFTGAIRDRVGRFESAENGTIFLDEIDAFTPALQVKLLRVLQDGEFERVGETRTRKANVRIIAATNQDLLKAIREGRFRHDLYYRLNIISIELPPLRDRKEDIPLLVEHFIAKHAKNLNKKIDGIEKEACQKLMSYAWPGNVRELENVIERACVLTAQGVIKEAVLPESVFDAGPAERHDDGGGRTAESPVQRRCLKDALRAPERKIIVEALQKSRGNKKEAARLLGINRTTLYKKLSVYGISDAKSWG